VTEQSDLDILQGYFRVNDYMQSTSFPNIFAGGDCVTMETYAEKRFPPKAGVYAVRAGPIIAQNVANFITGTPLIPYIPQTGFLALLMTGDEKAVGTKFGIAFSGRWVWKMKDYIDGGFMKLFNPKYLFSDYTLKGFAEPLENNELFDEEKKGSQSHLDEVRATVLKYTAEEAAKHLKCDEEEEEFHSRL
jgi:NADPH-dependent 2,4-dienoyl-CoA reductase/sulfur reductase-like enzyme